MKQGDDDVTEAAPLPNDPEYWAQVEEEAGWVPDGADGGFFDTRPQEYAPLSPMPAQPLLPQVMTESLVNIEAEAAVIGALMIDNSLLAGPCAVLVADDFADALHQRLFAAIGDIVATGKKATPVTLWPRFAKDSALTELGGPGYLAGLTGSNIALLAAGSNAEHLAELATRRRLAGAAQAAAQALADPSHDIGSAIDHLDRIRQAQSASGAAMATVCMASLHGIEVPARQWVVKGWMPATAVTFVAGPGGVGKSLVVQQWLTAISLGLNFMGAETVQAAPTLYVTCEDEADEVARRNADIATALGYSIRALTDVHTISLAGSEGNELGTFDAERRYKPTERFARIVATAKAIGARVVALDNVAHLYTGNENVRGEVTQFVNLLTRLALEIGGAVILLGHPAKAEGSEYSGSTAWENAVRSRLFLGRPEGEEDDGQTDPNARILTRSKANYAAKGDALNMVWHHGAFVEPSAVPQEAKPQFEAAGLHNERFLACLDAAIKQGRAVSHNPRAGNFAPRQFVKMPGSRGMTQAHFEGAMERLLVMCEIVTDAQMPFRDTSRRAIFALGRQA